MTIVADTRPRMVIGGVDTHRDVHVVAALDERGGVLGSASFPTDEAGYRSLLAWLESFGPVARVGVEGTGAYGAALARHLAARRLRVVEVDRPNRQQRRRRGKSDPLDALAAARAVLSGEATGVPKAGDGPVEAIRVLRIARRSAASQRIEALNQLRALVVTCAGPLRQRLTNTTCYQLVERAAALRPGLPDRPASATRWALRTLARRIRNLETELDQLDCHLEALVRSYAPDLLACFGVGVDVAGALLCAVGDNPTRLRSEAAFAHLCGVAPVPASSGQTVRHRLSRGGNRQANCALWRVVMVRLRNDPTTRAYLDSRIAKGKTKREAVRNLKRYVARELYRALPSQLRS